MKRILVVDDEIQVRELLKKALTGEGYDVVTAPFAAQAFDQLFREFFDLIILDLKLADESGMSILKKTRAISAKIPIVIYSGTLTPELEKEARLGGATEVLEKGHGVDPLVMQIRKILKTDARELSQAGLRKDKKILFVDDEPGIRDILSKFFKDKGYSTLQAKDGESALKIISEEAVSVVLLDIEMPGMDGLATLKKIKQIKPDLGVVMATGRQEDARVKEALASGAYSYVLKPFDFLYLDLVVTSKLAIADNSR